MRTGAAAALVLLALLAGGCGTGGLAPTTGDKTLGKKLFVSGCGSCHTLADAGTQGKVGPNLDDAFAVDRAEHYSDDTFLQVIRQQMKWAEPPMPRNIYRGAEADAVAKYVASVAGLAGPGAAPAAPAAAATVSAGGGAAAKGRALYASLGCQGCHSINGAKGTGPTFKGLAGSKVKLTTGQTVTADDAYLLRSIETPDAQIVAGFQKGLMSATIRPHSVSTADAKALVEFIKAQK